MKRLLKILCIVFIFAAFVFGAEKFFPDKTYIVKSAVMSFFGGEKAQLAKLGEVDTEKVSIEKLIERGALKNDSLMLINKDHPIPQDYEPGLTALGNGEIYVNSCVAAAYFEIKEAVKEKFDNSLYIMSAYRTAEEQEATAESEGELAAAAGASEHQAGLAIDVYVKYFAGEGFLKSPEGQFVNSSCQDYGFIIRYPYYGTEITGMGYESWHIRYVGFPHAEIIAENSLTFEEYIFSFEPGEIYCFDEYVVSRQEMGEDIIIPKGIKDIVLSEDNTGYIIITGKYK